MSKEFILNIVSFLAITTTIISFAPQAIKVYRTRSAKDICLITMFNAMLCSISWMIYGALINDSVVWGPNIILFFSSVYIIYFKIANKN